MQITRIAKVHCRGYGEIYPTSFLYKKNMKQIIYSNDKAYQLVRVLKEDSLKNPDISVLKQLYHCDTLLRKQGLLYFCRLIEEAEIITN